MKETYPGINTDISEWKGQEITDFQEDLLVKVNGRISEKWFYTHIKSSNLNLPRIDVLNLLSKYAGYSNWDDFRFRNSTIEATSKPKLKSSSIYIKIAVFLIVSIAVCYMLFLFFNTRDYSFTFLDADTGEPILNSKIQAELLLKDESPLTFSCNKEGKLLIRTDQGRIKMIIRSPYYLTDTIERTLKKFNLKEEIQLHADANALMIRYFSEKDVKSWQKRRESLDRMFDDNAMIYQLPDNKMITGMEIYNKQEFINQLTMPSTGLDRIEVLDKKYQNDRIILLRFRINRNVK